MSRLSVGEPFLNRQGPSPEGAQLVMGGGPQLQLFLSSPTPEELERTVFLREAKAWWTQVVIV